MPLLAVNHHYFRESGPRRGIYPISRELLLSEVGQLREHWRMADEEDVLAYCAGELTAHDRICVLTFDDGLKEQMDAIRALTEIDACAICYVPTAPIVDGVMLDVHKLHMIRSARSDDELAVSLDRMFDFSKYAFDDDMLTTQYRYDSPISRRVKYFLNFVLDKERRDRWMSTLFEELFGSEADACEQLYMDADDVRYLATLGLLGTHSHRHLPLATLSEHDATMEIQRSMDILESISGRAVHGISYPYGGKSAVSDRLFDIARQCGLRYGFTMERGINANDTRHDLFMKRIDTNDVAEWHDR